MRAGKRNKLTIIILIIVLIAVAAHRLHFKKYYEEDKQPVKEKPQKVVVKPPLPTIKPVPLVRVMPHANNPDAKFIASLLPVIRDENAHIFSIRRRLDDYYVRWLAKEPLSKSDLNWLEDKAAYYQVANADFNSASTWHLMLRRIDIVPASLALAQAIEESAWGRSRFAREGNNYFGRWCYTRGCGIIPKARPHGASYEVMRFPSVLASVKDYMHNLNSDIFYQQLRKVRAQMRQQHKPLSGYILAESLNRYSQSGRGYVAMLQTLITQSDLQRYDG